MRRSRKKVFALLHISDVCSFLRQHRPIGNPSNMLNPIQTILGSLLLHLSTATLLLNNGRVLDISFMFHAALTHPSLNDAPVLVGMILGVVAASLLSSLLSTSLLPSFPDEPNSLVPVMKVMASGTLMGWATKVLSFAQSGIYSTTNKNFPLANFAYLTRETITARRRLRIKHSAMWSSTVVAILGYCIASLLHYSNSNCEWCRRRR
jgi:hypothetical protein